MEPDNPLPMRPYRLVFAVRDRDGNEVRLTESQWRGHILLAHPEVEPFLEAIRDVVLNPEIVRLGDRDDYRLASLGAIAAMPNRYLRVVITYSQDIAGRRIGSVRTAHFSKRPPGGEDVL